MTSRANILLLFMAAALDGGGCGNYSNEDLEFMNALPEGDELRAGSPAGSAVVILDPAAAELARGTHEVSRNFNGIVVGVVSLVDLIRSFPPSARTPNSRIWGPAPDDKHPGWQWRMIMSRAPGNDQQFLYDIAFHRIGAADTAWFPYLNGHFQADATARRGVGGFQVDTAAVRAAEFPADGYLNHMDVEYSLGVDLVTVHMDLTNLDDPSTTEDIPHAIYDYAASTDGRRQMSFQALENTVPAVAISRWLDTGEGKATITIFAAGVTQTQCWDRQLHQTYNVKPWAPAENFGGDESVCPVIEPLPTAGPSTAP